MEKSRIFWDFVIILRCDDLGISEGETAPTIAAIGWIGGGFEEKIGGDIGVSRES